MNIPHELKRCKACTDFTERLLADRVIELRIQSDKMRSQMGNENTLSSIDGKESDTSYKESVMRLRQALSNYVKLEDDPQQTPIEPNSNSPSSDSNSYNRTKLFMH